MPDKERSVVESIVYQVKGRFVHFPDAHDKPVEVEFARVFMADSVTQAEELAFLWLRQLHGGIKEFEVLHIAKGEKVIRYAD